MLKYILLTNLLITYLLVAVAFPARAVDQKSLNTQQVISLEEQAHFVDLVPELSGLAVTRRSAIARSRGSAHKLIWSHNDSGHAAEVFGFEVNGQVKTIIELPVEAIDIEDIAAKACPWSSTQQCLWLADVGDNKHKRQSVSLHVVPLPNTDWLASKHILRLKVDRSQISSYRFTYPNGQKPNVEALAVAPHGRQVWLFEKSDAKQVKFWSLTIPTSSLGASENLTSIQEYKFDVSYWPSQIDSPRQRRITGADIDQSGRRLILRTYQDVWLYESHLSEKITAETITEQKPQRIKFTAYEAQGEAISFDIDHQSFWTGSEAKYDHKAEIHHTYF